jgi:SNF2 family DNA or RNA helicase
MEKKQQLQRLCVHPSLSSVGTSQRLDLLENQDASSSSSLNENGHLPPHPYSPPHRPMEHLTEDSLTTTDASYMTDSGKCNALLELLETYGISDHRYLIFCHRLETVELLLELLAARSIPAARLDGTIPVSSRYVTTVIVVVIVCGCGCGCIVL